MAPTSNAGDKHIAFAFADSGYPPDWARLEEPAGALAEQFPLDFPAIVKRLREETGRAGQ
jgi:spermidine synthase